MTVKLIGRPNTWAVQLRMRYLLKNFNMTMCSNIKQPKPISIYIYAFTNVRSFFV